MIVRGCEQFAMEACVSEGSEGNEEEWIFMNCFRGI